MILDSYDQVINGIHRTDWHEKKMRHYVKMLLVGLIASGISLGVADASEAVNVESNLVYGSAVDYTGSNVLLTLDAYDG